MKIACLNMGFHVMSNQIKGSESEFVEYCHQVYPRYQGWFDASKQISYATNNVAHFLLNYDIFALQEVNERYKEKFFETIGNGYKFITSYYSRRTTSLVIGYDENITGKAVKITHNLHLGSRAIQMVWFEQLTLLFINLHAPHNVDIKYLVEQTCNNVVLNIKPDQIIMCGDFNDYKGNLLNQSINIFGTELRIPSANIVKTCCYDNDYDSPGDYFFVDDSVLSPAETTKIVSGNNYKDNFYFGLPFDYDRELDLYSDHDPIILIQ